MEPVDWTVGHLEGHVLHNEAPLPLVGRHHPDLVRLDAGLQELGHHLLHARGLRPVEETGAAAGDLLLAVTHLVIILD